MARLYFLVQRYVDEIDAVLLRCTSTTTQKAVATHSGYRFSNKCTDACARESDRIGRHLSTSARGMINKSVSNTDDTGRFFNRVLPVGFLLLSGGS
jgi:hypothetical protein